jgi:hypothetical protein
MVTPGQHDPGEPAPRADPFQNDVAGHFEEEIADEEQRCAKSIGIFAESEITDHLQLGITDILAVDIGDQIDQSQERDQAKRDLANHFLRINFPGFRVVQFYLPTDDLGMLMRGDEEYDSCINPEFQVLSCCL